MVNRLELYNNCVKILDDAEIPNSNFDVLCIFQDLLNNKNPLFKPDEPVIPETAEKIFNLTVKRSKGYPLQYLLGEWDFWKYRFKVGEGVLIPRPDTETLIENVLDICKKSELKSPKILDLCSGSGCIAITLSKEIPHSQLYAVENSDTAFKYLEKNIEFQSADVRAVKADVLISENAEKFRDFDIIVSNPPYLTAEEMQELQKEVQAEPESALFGGSDGLDFYRAITEIWSKCLKKGGYICYEFGMGQHEAVSEILRLNNFINISLTKDTGDIIRTVTAEKN